MRLTENDKRTLRRFDSTTHLIDRYELWNYKTWRMGARRLHQLAEAGFLVEWQGRSGRVESDGSVFMAYAGVMYSLTDKGRAALGGDA